MLKRAVITGMGVVSPNGIGKTAFCRAILDGKSGVKLISRFDTSDLPVKIAGEIQDFNELDWIDARERKHVSRCVPLAVAASTEALKDAGIDHEKMSLDEKREIGVVLGTGGGAHDFSDAQYHMYYAGKVKQISIFSIPSGTMGTMSSEVSMRFGFRGMSHVVTSGCTSSTDGIAYATRQLQLGTLPMMLVGGVDSPLAWGILKGFTFMRIMTESWNNEPERGSRPFNLDRDGFVLAEGSWMFVLEEYEHARLAMKEAGIAAENVQYVNLHGTSTDLNDRIETRALKLALGDHAYKVPMSALKSQIGHPQGACGAAGVAATLIAMQHNQIPPTINLEKPDPDCDLDYVPEVGRAAQIEHAVCNCIAFGSKNSALVLRRVN